MMKRLLPSFAAVAILLLGACSTNKLAQQNEQVDDAYYTEAQAREQREYRAQAEEKRSEPDYVTDEELYGDEDYDYNDRDYADRNYSARIYRFRNYSPWRSYHDTWYDYRYDPYYSSFNSYNYYNRPAFGINIGFGGYSGYNYYNPWRYYGSNYYGNYWGPYSYYNTYNPYYSNGFYGNYGNGYYGIGRPVIVNPNYRTRPNRETDNVRSGAYPGNNGGRIGTSPNRPERGATNNGTIDRSSQPSRTGTSRPSRTGTPTQERSGATSRPASAPTETRSSRPQRESSPPPRIESRPAERPSSPPPSSTPQRSSDQGSSRPSRTGNR